MKMCLIENTNTYSLGTETLMLARWQAVVDAFASVETAKLTNQIHLADAADELLDADRIPVNEAGGTQIGIPNLLRLQCIKFRGDNGGHLTFSPVMPPSGQLALDFFRKTREICAEHGFDFHAGFHLYQPSPCASQSALF